MTIRLPQDEAAAFDRAILERSVDMGRRIERNEAVRGLAMLFVGDPKLALRAVEAVAEVESGRQRGRGIDTGL